MLCLCVGEGSTKTLQGSKHLILGNRGNRHSKCIIFDFKSKLVKIK